MASARKVQMLILSMAALCAFFFQASSCLAERAGVIPCHEMTCHDSDAESPETCKADCCHLEWTAFLSPPLSLAAFSLGEAIYHSLDFGVPEAPVEEIDYPPQLLS